MAQEDITTRLKRFNDQGKENERTLQHASFICANLNSMMFEVAVASGRGFQLSDARGAGVTTYRLEHEELVKVQSLGLSGFKAYLADKRLDDDFAGHPNLPLELFNKLVSTGQSTEHMCDHFETLIIEHAKSGRLTGGSSHLIKCMIQSLEYPSPAVREFYMKLLIKMHPPELPEVVKACLDKTSSATRSNGVAEICLGYVRENADKELLEYVAGLLGESDSDQLKAAIRTVFGTAMVMKCTAATVQEAESRICTMVPVGFEVEETEVISDGLEKRIEDTGSSVLDVLERLRKKVPEGARIVREEILRDEREDRFIQVYSEGNQEPAVSPGQLGDDEEYVQHKLIKGATKGFLGLGKKPRLYQLLLSKFPRAAIVYRPQAELAIHLKLSAL